MYMGAISQSKSIFTKLNTHHSWLNSVRYAKFRANRRIYKDFGGPFTLNRTKIFMRAIHKSEPIFTKLNTHHFRLNSVRYAKFRANRMIFRAVPNFIQFESKMRSVLCLQFNMVRQADMHKSTLKVILCIFSKGTM